MHWLTIPAACLLVGSQAAPLLAGDAKARCQQLIDYYEWFGASRNENSDGGRDMTTVGAIVDCGNGRYEQGIKAMEELLRRKKFTVPPPTPG
jgi:hypothetical protein